MSRTPKFSVRKTDSGWMVNVPASMSDSRKRERHFHKTRDLAKEHASRLRELYNEHGAGAAVIRPALAEDASKAAAILAPWEISLTQAARQVVALLEEAQASKTIDDAGQLWTESFEGLRPRSIKSYKTTLDRMIKSLSGRLMTHISADEIVSAIKTSNVSAETYSLHRRNARAFWNWSSKKGWCEKSVFERVEAPRKSTDKEIHFLSPDEAEELLRSAEKHYPAAVPMYAIALFAGVRAEELRKIEIEHVNAEGINLPAKITKKGRRRYIALNATLSGWLQAYPFSPCPNWRHVDCAVRRLAGWDVASELLENPPKSTRGRWPQNALRHTHATYAIASGTPLERLLFEFGHSGGVETLRKHYVGRATKKQAESFFSLLPNPAKTQTELTKESSQK